MVFLKDTSRYIGEQGREHMQVEAESFGLKSAAASEML